MCEVNKTMCQMGKGLVKSKRVREVLKSSKLK